MNYLQKKKSLALQTGEGMKECFYSLLSHMLHESDLDWIFVNILYLNFFSRWICSRSAGLFSLYQAEDSIWKFWYLTRVVQTALTGFFFRRVWITGRFFLECSSNTPFWAVVKVTAQRVKGWKVSVFKLQLSWHYYLPPIIARDCQRM